MKKKIIALFVVAVIFALLVAYLIYIKKIDKDEKEKPMEIAQLTPNFPVTISQSMSFVIRKSQINEKYGEPNKSYRSGDYTYDIWNFDDDSKMVVIYDKSNALVHISKFKEPLLKEDFADIQIGDTTYDEVKKIDPYAYIFTNDKKAISEHILTNRELLHIEYEQEEQRWVVSEFEFMDDRLPFLDIYSIN